MSRNGNNSWIDCFSWIWLLDLTSDITGNCFVRIKNFYTGFCFKIVSIKDLSSGIYLWNYSELHVGTWLNTLEASFREFVSMIKDFVGGFYLASKSRTFARNCFCDILGTTCQDFVLNFSRSKAFVREFVFVTRGFSCKWFWPCNLGPMMTAWFVISWQRIVIPDFDFLYSFCKWFFVTKFELELK